MQILKKIFVFPILLILLYNVSGISIGIEHASHSKSELVKAKDFKGKVVSQDDQCQCDLHLQANHVLIPESLDIEFLITQKVNSKIPRSRMSTCKTLLDYFSSRAPPLFSTDLA